MSIFALWIGVCIFQSEYTHAFSRGTKSKKSKVSISVGARYWMHYNRVTVFSTPPESVLGEVQLNYWINGGSLGFQLSGATAVSMTLGTYFGAGIRLQALSFQSGKSAIISGLSLILFADAVLYNVAQPVSPETYIPSGFLFRYGASVNWGIGSGKVFLDTSMAVSVFQNNFFIGPYVGLGVKF